MNPKPPSCEGCPARHWGVGFVPPEGPETARVALVGQGPGQQEAEFGRPFYEGAPAGWRLRNWMRQTKPPLLESRSLFTNVVWCWLPKEYRGSEPHGNRTPTQEEVQFCSSRHLDPLLARMPQLEQVVAIGKPAAEKFLGPVRSGQRYLGTTHRVYLTGEENG